MTSRLQIAAAASLLMLASFAHADPIAMQGKSPFAENAHISQKIKTECVELQTKLPAYTEQFARSFGVDVKLKNSVNKTDAGQVLIVEITNAVSQGNAFIGHRKFSEVSGTLYRDGERVAGFIGARNSMGGFFAGYKGSCSVLGRTMKAMGKDIAEWLKDPQDEAELGDY